MPVHEQCPDLSKTAQDERKELAIMLATPMTSPAATPVGLGGGYREKDEACS